MAKDKRRDSSAPYFVLLVLGIILIALLLYIVPFRYGLNRTVEFTPTGDPLDNPLTGYAPWAENQEECADSQLVYIQLRWADWEPQEGVYDIEGLEERCHIAQWKAEHKNAVLRFVCDVPGKEAHVDIPGWLFSRTQDGAYYDGELGKGYSPDYANETFLERHQLAVQALANYCNQDDFVAFVELGSLGHWGEWHTDVSGGAPPMPEEEVCNAYVLHYSDSFHNARLLTRRNYSLAMEGGMGLYNDMTGDAKATQEWLGWLKNGGTQTSEGDPLTLTPVERFWDKAPVGGEFTSEVPQEDLLGRWYADTLESVESGHMTFLGPKCPEGDLKDSEAAQAIRERLGYRFYISKLQTEYSFASGDLVCTLTWDNVGLGGFYWQWPVTLYVYDKDGQLTFWETVDLDLRDLTPEAQIETVSHIPFTDAFREGYEVGIGISSNQRTQPVRLAMEGELRDDVQIIYRFEG